MDQKPLSSIIFEACSEIVVKCGPLISWITIGLIGKFSNDLIRGKRLNVAYVLGTTGGALFVGYLAGKVCYRFYPGQAPLIVPIVTLLSNNIISAMIAINWKKILAKDWRGAFEILLNKPKN